MRIGGYFYGGKAAGAWSWRTHLNLEATLRMVELYLHPPYVFRAWPLIKHKRNLWTKQICSEHQNAISNFRFRPRKITDIIIKTRIWSIEPRSSSTKGRFSNEKYELKKMRNRHYRIAYVTSVSRNPITSAAVMLLLLLLHAKIALIKMGRIFSFAFP
jgi:hypothetical protein